MPSYYTQTPEYISKNCSEKIAIFSPKHEGKSKKHSLRGTLFLLPPHVPKWF